MAVRTCAPTLVTAAVEACRGRGRAPRVGVAGFPGAYAATLAGLVRERCGQVDVHLGGPDLFTAHPDLDVRVWMDLDAELAFQLGAMEEFWAARRGARPGEEPIGEWVAGSVGEDRPQADPDLVAAFEAHRPDRAADVLFVPVGGIRPPIELRFMLEDSCDFVLWDQDNDWLDELEDLLPMPDDLRRRITSWPAREPGGAGDRTLDALTAHTSEGRSLAAELQGVLGTDFAVRFLG